MNWLAKLSQPIEREPDEEPVFEAPLPPKRLDSIHEKIAEAQRMGEELAKEQGSSLLDEAEEKAALQEAVDSLSDEEAIKLAEMMEKGALSGMGKWMLGGAAAGGAFNAARGGEGSALGRFARGAAVGAGAGAGAKFLKGKIDDYRALRSPFPEKTPMGLAPQAGTVSRASPGQLADEQFEAAQSRLMRRSAPDAIAAQIPRHPTASMAKRAGVLGALKGAIGRLGGKALSSGAGSRAASLAVRHPSAALGVGGAAVGAATNEDRLKGALVGGGMGYGLGRMGAGRGLQKTLMNAPSRLGQMSRNTRAGVMAGPLRQTGKFAEKTAGYLCSSDDADSWLGQFQGTPLQEQAVQLEQQLLDIEKQELEQRIQRRQSRPPMEEEENIWDARDQLRLAKKELELQLYAHNNSEQVSDLYNSSEEPPQEEVEQTPPNLGGVPAESIQAGQSVEKMAMKIPKSPAQMHREEMAGLSKDQREQHKKDLRWKIPMLVGGTALGALLGRRGAKALGGGFDARAVGAIVGGTGASMGSLYGSSAISRKKNPELFSKGPHNPELPSPWREKKEKSAAKFLNVKPGSVNKKIKELIAAGKRPPGVPPAKNKLAAYLPSGQLASGVSKLAAYKVTQHDLGSPRFDPTTSTRKAAPKADVEKMAGVFARAGKGVKSLLSRAPKQKVPLIGETGFKPGNRVASVGGTKPLKPAAQAAPSMPSIPEGTTTALHSSGKTLRTATPMEQSAVKRMTTVSGGVAGGVGGAAIGGVAGAATAEPGERMGGFGKGLVVGGGVGTGLGAWRGNVVGGRLAGKMATKPFIPVRSPVAA